MERRQGYVHFWTSGIPSPMEKALKTKLDITKAVFIQIKNAQLVVHENGSARHSENVRFTSQQT